MNTAGPECHSSAWRNLNPAFYPAHPNDPIRGLGNMELKASCNLGLAADQAIGLRSKIANCEVSRSDIGPRRGCSDPRVIDGQSANAEVMGNRGRCCGENDCRN
jgi:hypothetical protein